MITSDAELRAACFLAGLIIVFVLYNLSDL